jgi:hypothetical protein
MMIDLRRIIFKEISSKLKEYTSIFITNSNIFIKIFNSKSEFFEINFILI